MIAVDHYLAFGDVGHGVDDSFFLAIVLRGVALELHSDLDVRWESFARLHANQIRVVLAEGIFRLQRNRTLVADRFLRERCLDLGENSVMSTMKIGNRLR